MGEGKETEEDILRGMEASVLKKLSPKEYYDSFVNEGAVVSFVSACLKCVLLQL